MEEIEYIKYSASPNFGEGEVDGGGYWWRWSHGGNLYSSSRVT
jgi:hypothetical protein